MFDHPFVSCLVAALFAMLFAGVIYEERCKRRDARRYPPLGQLIDIGGRRLHILSKGSDGPTVVIEPGAGGPSIAWLGLQEEIAHFARVCLYDRAGYQWSDPAPAPRSLEDRVTDLYTLLAKATLPGPYVLVAHSYGGFLARLFTRDHRHNVAGLVLIDTPEEGVYFQTEVLSRYSQIAWMLAAMKVLSTVGLPRLLSRWLAGGGSEVPPHVRGPLNSGIVRREYFAAASDDILSLHRASHWLAKAGALGALGSLPVVVVTHGQPFPGPFAVLEKGWREGQERLAALSTNSDLVVAGNANHMIQHDDPKTVIDAIRRVVSAARAGAPLSAVGQNPRSTP